MLALPAGFLPTHATASDFSGTSLGGDAYGAAGPPFVGPVSYERIPCNPVLGSTYVGTSTSENAGPGGSILKANQVRDEGTPTATVDHAASDETSTIDGLVLLSGRITATQVQAHAHSRLDAGGLHTDATTTYSDLVIDNILQDSTSKNTLVNLPGVGYAVLNEEVPTANGIQVNGLHLHLVNVGDVVVAHAKTDAAPGVGRLGGYAYGAAGTFAPVVTAGRVNNLFLPCEGTGGTDLTQSAASTPAFSANGHTILSEAAISSTVNGSTTPGVDSHSREVIDSASLFDGLIQARVVTAAARTASTGAGIGSSGAGTSFVGLVINGTPTTESIPANTTVPLSGLGVAVLNEQVCVADPNVPSVDHSSCTATHFGSLTTAAIHITVNQPNSFGVPVGAELFIGVAHSEASL